MLNVTVIFIDTSSENWYNMQINITAKNMRLL